MAMILVAPIAANADNELYIGNNISGGIFPVVAGGYGKCANGISFNCATTYVKLLYTGTNGGLGSYSNPYIYTGCSFNSCVCRYDDYLSGNTCVDCPNNTVATSDYSYHTRTTCNQCEPTKLKKVSDTGVIECVNCPDNANGCNGTESFTCKANYYKTGYTCTACESGATSPGASTKHSDCCYPAGYGQMNSKGYWQYSAKCCYSD